MNYLILWRTLKIYFLKVFFGICEPERPKISLIIPFSSKDKTRIKNFKWLLEYWKHELPEAEIVVGRSKTKVFSKGKALNDAVRRSTGRVLVILDADAYMEGRVIRYCADRILEELKYHLWYVPYRHLYRLTKKITHVILSSDPENPIRIPNPVPPGFITNKGHESQYGHRFGAMCMIFPREAYDLLGCFDERFRGWGSEDVALLRALDTLYGKHKTVDENIFHLWHPFIGGSYKTRKWEGQKSANSNSNLAIRYHKAYRNVKEMRKLVDEAYKHKKHNKD